MFIIDLTNSLTLVLLLAATVLLIFLGKEVKKPVIPALALFAYLILVTIHSIQLATLTSELHDVYFKILINCISVDCIMIFVSFFAYLWIDDIASKFYKKKSIDNSLDWFWKEI